MWRPAAAQVERLSDGGRVSCSGADSMSEVQEQAVKERRSRARREPVCNGTCEGGLVAQRAASTVTASVAGTKHSSLQYRRTPHMLRVHSDIVPGGIRGGKCVETS